MKYDIIPRGHGQPIFVAKLGGHWLDEIKQAFATGRDIGTVLDIVGRPEAFGRGIVALVEQRIKRFQHEILVFLFGAHCLLLLFVICWVEGRVCPIPGACVSCLEEFSPTPLFQCRYYWRSLPAS